MNEMYYLNKSSISSHLLTEQRVKELCDFLGLPYVVNLEDINTAFQEMGFSWDFSDNRMVGISPNDDNMIGDIEALEPIAHIFIPDSWLTYYNDDGNHYRSIFRKDSIHTEEGQISFSPAAYPQKHIPSLIKELRKEIAQALAMIEPVVGKKEAITDYEERNNTILPIIGKPEWDAKHKDFKGIASGLNPDLPQGVTSILHYDNGTTLKPVRVIDSQEAKALAILKHEQEIAAIEADIETFSKPPYRDETLAHYLAAQQAKIAELRAQIHELQR